MSQEHVSVCICTYRRREMLGRLLDCLGAQDAGDCTYSIVVCDNDSEGSAEEIVRQFNASSKLSTVYCHEPERNIALARNRAIANASGEYIAFIDDDEFPVRGWIKQLVNTIRTTGKSGVLGPVRPHFDEAPPNWIIKGGFCERPEFETGRLMPWDGCRTGNLLLRREILQGEPQPFRPKFGSGGEDKDFFQRMTAKGHQFVWCNEAVAYESVPASRLRRSYMLKRALLRGRNTLKLSGGRLASVCKSAVAIPVYSMVLPVAFCLGQDQFMKYLIKMCDHLGKVLALVGLNPVAERQM